MKITGKQEFEFTRMNEMQGMLVLAGFWEATQQIIVALGNALPIEQRSEKMRELRARLLQNAKNSPISGIPMEQEREAVTALVKLIDHAFPDFDGKR